MGTYGHGPIVLGNAMSFSSGPLYSITPFNTRAAGGSETVLVGGLPAGYVDPNLKVTPGGGTAMGNNTYMIKSTDSPFLDLTADVGYDAGFMGLPANGYADGEREDAAPVFELQIPYFVNSGSGGLTEEYSYDNWKARWKRHRQRQLPPRASPGAGAEFRLLRWQVEDLRYGPLRFHQGYLAH